MLLINELRPQPQQPQAELKTETRDHQDLRPESGLTRHFVIVEVWIRVFTGVGRQFLGRSFPERCETVVTRGLAGDDIVELPDAGRAPHARIDGGHLGVERINIDQRLALKAVDRGNEEIGRLGEIPRKCAMYPPNGELRVYCEQVRGEGVDFRLADVVRREDMPPNVFGREGIRIDERCRAYTRPCCDLGDSAADAAAPDNSDTLLG